MADAVCALSLSLSASMGVTLQIAAQHAEPLFSIFHTRLTFAFIQALVN